jgi:hypothetical protein
MSASTMTKGQWVALFDDIGLDPATMRRWHQCFEARFPNQHQAFLEWLGDCARGDPPDPCRLING